MSNSNRDLELGAEKKRPWKADNHYYAAATTYVEEDGEWTPWLIPMFILASVVLFVAVMYVNDCPEKSLRTYGGCVAKFLGRISFQPLKENPLFGPSSSTLDRMGALDWNKIVHQKQGWRLITCMWLHAGVIHLLANMLCLAFVGICLEQQFGFVRVATIYLLSGFGGSILSSLFIQSRISVGASGALFGLVGAMVSELITNWTIYTNKAAALFMLIIIIALNLGLGVLPHVDNFAHIGGLLTGFLLGFILLVRPQFGWVDRQYLGAEAHAKKSKHKAYQYLLWLLALVLLIIGFIIGLVMLFKGESANDHCSWCHYLSCVPTSKWHCGNR
ncbi:RHOMBOID-like protein 2 [Rhodamnia argentea]|uniref:RHOMBOID-like protein n=1 Tax=Rhodamnia argentea TaxID=178133 RepID=A0A8B8NQP9_9MYRT|nr:RHOMBOID-like protein 2 [Rhodamnia argentea]